MYDKQFTQFIPYYLEPYHYILSHCLFSMGSLSLVLDKKKVQETHQLFDLCVGFIN